MICPFCQKEIPDNSSFCTYCGAALSQSAQAANPYAVGSQTGAAYSASFDPNAPDIPGFGGAIKTCFSKYCTFKGRASRSEYWYWTLFLVLISLGVQIALAATGVADGDGATNGAALIISTLNGIWGLVTLLPGIGVIVRRLHDTDRSGWYYWIILIPIIGFILILLAFVKPSTPGPNKYGAQPVKRG